MGSVVAIGDPRRLSAYALAGATVVPAASPAAIDVAWDGLDADAELLVLSPEAREQLAGRLDERDDLIWAVLP